MDLGKGTRKAGIHNEVGCCLDCALWLPLAMDLNLVTTIYKLHHPEWLTKLFWISVSIYLIRRMILLTMNCVMIK